MFEEVKAQLGEPEIVELATLCAFRNLRNRRHEPLQIYMNPVSSATNPQHSGRVDANKLRDYAQRLADSWPDEVPTGARGVAKE